MASTLDQVHSELSDQFSPPGGHVEWTGEYFDAVSADAAAITMIPQMIDWVLRHKGIHIFAEQATVGHRTISHWHYETLPWGRRVRIPEPNRFIGYIGWKP